MIDLFAKIARHRKKHPAPPRVPDVVDSRQQGFKQVASVGGPALRSAALSAIPGRFFNRDGSLNAGKVSYAASCRIVDMLNSGAELPCETAAWLRSQGGLHQKMKPGTFDQTAADHRDDAIKRYTTTHLGIGAAATVTAIWAANAGILNAGNSQLAIGAALTLFASFLIPVSKLSDPKSPGVAAVRQRSTNRMRISDALMTGDESLLLKVAAELLSGKGK